MAVGIRDITDADLDWLADAATEIGGPKMVAGGFVHDLTDYPALIAHDGETRLGFLVYRLGNVRAYILGIRSTEPRRGLGSMMLAEFEQRASAAGKTAVRLSTTNDNLPALRFAQLRGYRLRQLIPGAFLEAKKLKGIPSDQKTLGVHGIEIRDEIILNKDL